MKRITKIIICIIIFFLNTNYVLADNLNCNKTLKKGNEGKNVITLQTKLNQYMNCNLKVDGIFGSKTYACVTKFQDKYNLEIDGIVGKKTCNKLNSNLKIISEEKLKVAKSNNIVVTKEKSKILSNIDKSNSIIKNVKQGDILTYTKVVKKKDISWYKVNINGRLGYIKLSDVTKNVVLVDISQQKLVYFKNGKPFLNTNVVTGMKEKHDTPTGKYSITYKQKGRTLRGYNDDGSKYAAYVDYWMRFIDKRGIGFHDASWRYSDEFNESTYLYDGSHGCINMQKQDAKKLYNNLELDTTVIIRK